MAGAFPLDSVESIVIDGANSVTGASRLGFPDSAMNLTVFAVVLVVAALVVRTRFRRPALAAVLVGAAASGWWALVVQRADAPHRRGVASALVKTALADLSSHDSVRIVRDDGDVLFPLARYAWPARPASDAGVPLELRGSVLISACHADAVTSTTVCGVGP